MLKRILVLFILLLACLLLPAQNKWDELNEEAIEFYNSGKKDKAVKIWKKIMRKRPDSSRDWGMAANNIQHKYLEEGNLNEAARYRRLIVNSNLDDRDRTPNIMEPYGNYRHFATMRLASLYAKNEDFQMALKLVNEADTLYKYETFSMTSWIYNKVELAFWKYDLYRDMGKPDSADWVMINRGLDNDYWHHGDWASWTPKDDEVQLADYLFEPYSEEELSELKDEMDGAFSDIQLQPFDTLRKAHFSLNGLQYAIPVYWDLNSEEAEKKFKESVLYRVLLEKLEEDEEEKEEEKPLKNEE